MRMRHPNNKRVRPHIHQIHTPRTHITDILQLVHLPVIHLVAIPVIHHIIDVLRIAQTVKLPVYTAVQHMITNHQRLVVTKIRMMLMLDV